MSSYINLLNEPEIRYHSAASESKSLKWVAGLMVVGILAYVVMSVMSFFSTTWKASALKSSWAKQEQKFNEAMVKMNLNVNSTRAKGELSGWAKGRIQGIKLLEAIHGVIPPEIQLTEAQLGSILSGIEGEPLRSRSSKKLDAPERNYTLILKGVAVSPQSEKPVFKLVEDLKNEAFLKSLGVHVELDEANRTNVADPVTKRPLEGHRFSITCRFSPRPYMHQ